MLLQDLKMDFNELKIEQASGFHWKILYPIAIGLWGYAMKTQMGN